jgi:hypothetical protein
MEKRCDHCKRKFTPHPAVKKQRYCKSADCQRARKRMWQKEKLKKDPDYREQNRLRQRERNRMRLMIAKMDEHHAKTAVAPGRYRLVPLYGTIAKMDELIVEIGVIAQG